MAKNFIKLFIPLLLGLLLLVWFQKRNVEVSVVRSSIDGREYVVQNIQAMQAQGGQGQQQAPEGMQDVTPGSENAIQADGTLSNMSREMVAQLFSGGQNPMQG